MLESYNDLRDAQKRQEQAKVDADDKQLDAVHALVQLAPEEELALHTKLMSLPPKPTRPIREKAIEDTLQDSLDWQTVVMEYRNFAFVKRMIFFIFQVAYIPSIIVGYFSYLMMNLWILLMICIGFIGRFLCRHCVFPKVCGKNLFSSVLQLTRQELVVMCM